MAALKRLEHIANHLTAPPSNRLLHPSLSPTCGIVGYVGKEPRAFDFLLEGLKILENRGYDSAGITTVKDDILITTKYASSRTTSDAISRLGEGGRGHTGDCVGIAHTRWATHGAKTDVNAHPHHDSEGLVSIVHNGVIDNADEIREKLKKKGIRLHSQTDSEVIAQLLGQAIKGEKDKEGQTLKDAVLDLQRLLQGTWGLVAVSVREPHQIIATCHGSPLLLGVGEGCMFVASEAAAFQRYTNEFIVLRDDEVAVITPNGHSLEEKISEFSEKEVILSSPDPFPHWTIREIMEQPESISRSLGYGGRFSSDVTVKLGGLDLRKSDLLGIRHLLIVGCGTSRYAGMYGAKVMRGLGGLESVRVVDASEVTRGDVVGGKGGGGGMVVLSQSGETKDCHRAVVLGGEEGVVCFSIVNAVRSLIARTTNCGIYVHAGRECGVASTKSFTCQVVCLCLVAIWFAQNSPNAQASRHKRQQLIQDLHRLPTVVGMILNRIRPQCHRLADTLKEERHAFILGRGMGEAIAYEGALKLKEITYIHFEGYAGGALKHGPFALIEEGTLIFVIILDDEHMKYMLTVSHEVHARGAKVIAITNSPSITSSSSPSLFYDTILLPHDGGLSSLLAVLPFQMLAYEIAVAKGLDPDRPRNLAKCVTVD